jgi:DnaJ-class molecular chaperone
MLLKDTIKKSYLNLQRIWHPDKNIGGDIDLCTKISQNLNKAWDIIQAEKAEAMLDSEE